MKLDVDYAEFSLLIESLLSERQRLKHLMKCEVKESPVYGIYENAVKRIDKFLVKLRDCE